MRWITEVQEDGNKQQINYRIEAHSNPDKTFYKHNNSALIQHFTNNKKLCKTKTHIIIQSLADSFRYHCETTISCVILGVEQSL